MPIVLWILNALLALAFLATGAMKLARPRTALVDSGMAWAGDTSTTNVKLIGVAEVIGAVGLILPRLTGIAPILTPLAATGLTLVMVGAVIVHLRRRESATPALVLAILAAASAVIGFAIV